MLTLALLLAAQPPETRTFELVAPGGEMIGAVQIFQAPRGILLRVEANGLKPGWHGVHLHQKADCSDAAFKNSGGHVHGAGVDASIHGLLNPMATDLGDIPNIYAASNGSANAEFFLGGLSLSDMPGKLNLFDDDGSALVIHADADDHMSQPIGGAGARVACAEIR